VHHDFFAGLHAGDGGADFFHDATAFVAHEVRQRAAFFPADLLELRTAEAGDQHADEDLAKLKRAGGLDLGEEEGGVVGGEERGEHQRDGVFVTEGGGRLTEGTE
jgi:hypothetical protein